MSHSLEPEARLSPEALEALLRDRAELLARRKDPETALHEDDEVLVVKAGSLRCAIGLTEIDRVITLSDLTPLPNAPPLAAGLTYVEGQILTVIDLARALGGRSREITAVLLTGEGDTAVALGIDTYLGVQSLPAASLGPPPTPLKGPAARYLLETTPDGIARLELSRLVKDLLSRESEDQNEKVK